MKEPSIYHEYEYYEILKDELNGTDEWFYEMEGPYKNYGYSILLIIAKYIWINKKNIEQCVNLNNPTSWKKSQLTKTLKMLRKGGYIQGLGFKENDSTDNYSVVLYSVTDKAAELFKNNNEKIKVTTYKSITKEDIPEILQRASINQWHISTLGSYKGIIKKSRYYSVKPQNCNYVPSMVTATITKKINDKKVVNNVTLFAYPAPRKEENLKDFLIEIIRLEEYLAQYKQYRPSLIVAVCENLQHASWLSWCINRYRQTRPFYVEYTMDLVTSRNDPLRMLYDCDTDENGIVQTNLNLIDAK